MQVHDLIPQAMCACPRSPKDVGVALKQYIPCSCDGLRELLQAAKGGLT